MSLTFRAKTADALKFRPQQLPRIGVLMCVARPLLRIVRPSSGNILLTSRWKAWHTGSMGDALARARSRNPDIHKQLTLASGNICVVRLVNQTVFFCRGKQCPQRHIGVFWRAGAPPLVAKATQAFEWMYRTYYQKPQLGPWMLGGGPDLGPAPQQMLRPILNHVGCLG